MRDIDPRDPRFNRRPMRTSKTASRAGATRKSASGTFLLVSRNLPLTHALSQATSNASLDLAIYPAPVELVGVPFWTFDAVILDASLWDELAHLLGSRAAVELSRTPVVLIDPLDEVKQPQTVFPVRIVARCTGPTSAALILESALNATRQDESARQALLAPELRDDPATNDGP